MMIIQRKGTDGHVDLVKGIHGNGAGIKSPDIDGPDGSKKTKGSDENTLVFAAFLWMYGKLRTVPAKKKLQQGGKDDCGDDENR